MSSIQTLLVGIIGLLLAGCLSPSHAESLPLRSLAKAAFSGIQDPKQELIKDKAAWEKAWSDHLAGAKDASKGAPPLPEVDFAKEMVVMASMGRQNSGGYAIQVTGAKIVGDKLQISVGRATPPPGAMTIQALTAPIHFVAIPRSDLKPEFVEVQLPGKPRNKDAEKKN